MNIDLDVNSYDAAGDGGRTEVGLNVSKQFLDDRLTVQVGGDMEVEDRQARQNAGSSGLAGNVSVMYDITEDGRIQAKLFRQNRFEGLIEGELTETGAALIYARDYDKFKELFKKKKEEDDFQIDEENEIEEEQGDNNANDKNNDSKPSEPNQDKVPPKDEDEEE